MDRKLKVLFISSQFPNKEQPVRGMYNFHQISYLKKYCDVKVCSPFYWFMLLKKGNKGAILDNIPEHETIGGIEVLHPRAFYIPKFMRFLYGYFYFLSVLPALKKIKRDFDFDCIYVNWMYPDSYAGMLFSKYFKCPYVACCLGSDVNMYLKTFFRGRMILDVVRNSFKTFTVSENLKKKLVEHLAQENKLETLYDGVDANLFYPMDRQIAEKRLGFNHDEKRILYVGAIETWKGPQYLVDAFYILKKKDDGLKLYIVGDGPYCKQLLLYIKSKNLSESVILLGNRAHGEIPFWLNACDVFCLPSLTEGVPNVVLEAMACGVFVVATSVGGVPEILNDRKLGVLVKPKDVVGLADGLEYALGNKWDREYITSCSKKFSWDDNALRLKNVLSDAVVGYGKK